MKLYEIPNGSILEFETDEGVLNYTFNRIDGAFSHCMDKDGGVVHFSAYMDVEPTSDINKFLII